MSAESLSVPFKLSETIFETLGRYLQFSLSKSARFLNIRLQKGAIQKRLTVF